MSVKVEVPQSMKDNEMNDTKGVWIGKSRGELDLSNDTSLFLVIAQSI